MSEVVLDASALLAFLKDEPGGGAVRQLLPTPLMSAIELAEFATTDNFQNRLS
jgi:PIN domain nuclease of toxin-antitoxin system